MPSGFRLLGASIALFLGCNFAACNLDNPGDAPPHARLYFPNALVLSPHDGTAARYLYVANSDVDLRYNAGTVQAYSLDRLDQAIAACDPKDEPGCPIAPDAALDDEVTIAAFSTSMAATPSGDRLVVTARTSDSLIYVHANPAAAKRNDVLTCEGGDLQCGELAERGPDRHEDDRTLRWPEEPVAVMTGSLGDWLPEDVDFDGSSAGEDAGADAANDAHEYALVAHRGGQMSLFVEDGQDMVLTDVLSAAAVGATDLAYDRDSRFVYATLQYPANARWIVRLSVSVPMIGGAPDPLHAAVLDAGTVTLQPVEAVGDTRGIAFLDAEPAFGPALATPSAVIAAQHPSSLLLADVVDVDATSVGDRPRVARVKGAAAVGVGAAHVVAGVVADIPIALVASFDSRELALVDLRTMLTRSVVPNLSGPFAVALDEARARAYVTDFRSSVIRILDLKPALEDGGDRPIEVIATLGKPRVLQELR